MNTSLNISSSVQNLTQIDRHQGDINRTPINSQYHNAQITLQEAQRRMNMPVQPDAVDKKKVDAEQSKKEFNQKKKKKREDKTKPPPGQKNRSSSGQFVDIDA